MAKGYVADKLKRPTARDLVVEEDADALNLVRCTALLLFCLCLISSKGFWACVSPSSGPVVNCMCMPARMTGHCHACR